MKIKVIKITQGDKVGYLRSASIFGGGQTPVVDTPIAAKNYALPEHEGHLENDINMINLPGKYRAMSGVRVDSAHVVELELNLSEVSSYDISTEVTVKKNKP